MSNEQCGICWELKYDNQGNHTHGPLHPHDFSPFDFCLNCKEPKFDNHGFLTHPSIYDVDSTKPPSCSNFVSSIHAKDNSQKRKKIIFAFTGISSVVATVNSSLMSLFY